eukprot:5746471-Prymnesium_polylepis.1
MPHAQCQDACTRLGGVHACVNSETENTALDGVLGATYAMCSMSTQIGCGWIGLYQNPTNQGSRVGWDNWASGCNSNFTKWQPGEPNDYTGDENCGAWCHSNSRVLLSHPVTATGTSAAML